MKNILLITNAYPSKEKPYAGVFVMNQYRWLQEKKVPVSVFFMKRSFTGIFGSLLKYMKAFIRFIPVLFKFYEIVHLHFFYPLIILAYAYKLLHPKSMLVITFHGSDINSNAKGKGKMAFYSFLAKKANKVITVSDDLKETVQEKLKIKVSKVLCAGVDKNIFYPIPNVVKKYDFCFVGSFSEIKGADLLIQAIQKWNNKKLNFAFVGSGCLEKEIDNLRLLGFNSIILSNLNQEELRLVYNKSRWVILPSRRDAFGLVVTEAMFCGTPVIGSPLPGIKEQITMGINGCILDQLNANSIIYSMKKASNIPTEKYKSLSTTSKNSNQQFSLDNIGNQLIKLYDLN